jgi:hypothetical protein
MKNLIGYFIIALTLFGALSCNKQDALNPDEQQEDKIPTKTSGSKVQITFEEVPNNAWIQLDEHEKFYHYLDTNKFIDQQDGTVIIQINYPRDMPLIEDFSTGWVSKRYFVGAVSGRWFNDYSSGGLPAYSLFRNLAETRTLANPYGIKPLTTKIQYKISFENIKTYSDSLKYYYSFPNGRGFSDKKEADKYAILNIERLDGKDIKIQTSEGYKIKIVYQ